jgi:hypothetical protein
MHLLSRTPLLLSHQAWVPQHPHPAPVSLLLLLLPPGHILRQAVGPEQQQRLVLPCCQLSQWPEWQWQQLGPGPPQVWTSNGTCCAGPCQETGEHGGGRGGGAGWGIEEDGRWREEGVNVSRCGSTHHRGCLVTRSSTGTSLSV